MAKPADVLKRIIVLLERGKVQDADIHGILNGAMINGEWLYIDGDYLYKGKRHVLSADRMNNIVWPVKAKAPRPESPESKKHKKGASGL